MAYKRERRILQEFIELYCELPCLWDMSSDSYKDKIKKAEAWSILTEKLVELEPNASVVVAKKKIEHFRTAYKREAKKVRESRRTASEASEVHMPGLWYYKILNSILGDEEQGKDKDDEQETRAADPLAIDEEPSERDRERSKTRNKASRKSHSDRALEWKKQKYQTTKERVQRGNPENSGTQNSFLVYVGEQLNQVDTFQRNVAEKLISEVLFFAKTGNLTLETRIETPSSSRALSSSINNSYSQCRSPQIAQTSPTQSSKGSSSPQHVITSYHLVQPSPSHASSRIGQRSDSVSTEENYTNYDTECLAEKSVLKELLTLKKPM